MCASRSPTKLFLWSAFFISCVALNFSEEESGDPYAIYDGKYLLKVTVCNQEAVKVTKKALEDTDCSFLSEEGTLQLPVKGCGEEYIVCAEEFVERLVADVGADIEEKDAGAFFRKSGGTTHGYDASGVHAQNEFYTAYRNLAAIEARIKQVVDNSNGIAKLEELSPKTHEGRTIKMVRIRDSLYKPGRPRVLLTFQIHAREWVAGMTGMYTVEYLIEALKAEPDFIQGMEIILVPISNPDGFAFSAASNRFWRKNRNTNGGGRCQGVDLNRNWDTAWNGGESTSTNQCRDVYVGTKARSEPESQALGKLITEAPTTVHIDIHCFSELILGAWGYTKNNHPEKPKIDKLGQAMNKAIRAIHGKNYKYGTGGEVIYLASGTFPDWATTNGAIGYCYELRPSGRAGRNGFAPPASQILPTAEEAIQGLYTAIDWAKDQGDPLPAPTRKPPVAAPAPPFKPPSPPRGRHGNTRRRGSSRRRRSSKTRRRGGRRRRRRRRSENKSRRRSKPKTTSLWQCSACNNIYVPAKHGGGKPFGDLPSTWKCPVCGEPKSAYKKCGKDGCRGKPMPTSRWQCSVCKHIYNPPKDGGGKPFGDVPSTWTCPICGQPKSAYKKCGKDGCI